MRVSSPQRQTSHVSFKSAVADEPCTTRTQSAMADERGRWFSVRSGRRAIQMDLSPQRQTSDTESSQSAEADERR